MWIRSLIDSMTRFLGLIRRWRRITPKSLDRNKLIKVNLGCGLAVAPGWWNVDASLNALIAGLPFWMLKIAYRVTGAKRYYEQAVYCSLLSKNKFVHHDLGHSIPFVNNSVDFVYSSHFMEHLFKKQAIKIFNESYRVLKPDGVIRVGIPDLAYAIEMYNRGQKDAMLNNYFFVEDMGSFLARHKYMYDFELLEKALIAAGFVNVVECNYQEGKTPDINLLDNRPEETLFVEAIKPTKDFKSIT